MSIRVTKSMAAIKLVIKITKMSAMVTSTILTNLFEEEFVNSSWANHTSMD